MLEVPGASVEAPNDPSSARTVPNPTFLKQFAAIAEARLTRALALLEDQDPAAGARLAHELHSLAGEAGVIGLRELSLKAAEAEARRMSPAAPGATCSSARSSSP